MSGTVVDNFENGIFWELYSDLERQFQNFLEYVPYLPENEKTISFKLLNLILSIGGHVDSAFKEMARYPKFSGNNDCREILEKIERKETIPITLPLKAFETEYKLSEKTVKFKRLPERQNITPFKPRSSGAQSPLWWKIYNGIKHDVALNLRDVTLQNTRDALAGAFLLNVLHKPAKVRFLNLGVLRVVVARGAEYVYRMTLEEFENAVEEAKDDQTIQAKLETPLFIYDYVQRE